MRVRARRSPSARASDESARAIATAQGPTHAFYRELYARYDVVKTLGGPFTLELQGWHRRRHETLGAELTPWLEGEHTTGVGYGAAWLLALGNRVQRRHPPADDVRERHRALQAELRLVGRPLRRPARGRLALRGRGMPRPCPGSKACGSTRACVSEHGRRSLCHPVCIPDGSRVPLS
jgi:hypothetical protein